MARFDLVFEGGGAKGMVFVGALQAFEEADHTHGRVLGTSAGAITAALLAAGYDSQEIREALDPGSKEGGRSVFAGFLGLPPACGPQQARDSVTAELLQQLERAYLPKWLQGRLTARFAKKLLSSERVLPRHLCSFLEHGGLYSADSFCSWMRKRLDAGSFDGQPRRFGNYTLSQFHQATGTELCLVASDTTAGDMLVLNHQTAPACPVVSAVQMSMSIPLLWQEVKWDREWGEYQGEDITDHVVVDGGILSNFPIELLVSDLPAITDTMGAGRAENFLGLLIDETLPVESPGPQGGPPATAATEQEKGWQDLRSVDRLARLIDTMTSMRTKQLVDAFEAFVVRLPAKGYTTTEFQMSPARFEALRSAGRRAMRDYLESNERLVADGTASREYERAAEHANRMAQRHLGLGRKAKRRRDHEGALDSFRKAVAADSSSQEALWNLVRAQEILALRDVSEQEPAQARLRLRKIHDLLDSADLLDGTDTGTARVLLQRGYLAKHEAQVFDAEGDQRGREASLKKAARLFDEVLELEPGEAAPHDLAAAWNGLGNVYGIQEQSDQAVACFEKAISLNPGYAHAFHDLAVEYYDIGERRPTRELMRKELDAWTQALECDKQGFDFTKDKITWIEGRIAWLESQLDKDR